jgi:hypothetical protein
MTFDNALDAIKDLRQAKTLSPLIQFTGQISLLRSMVYAYLCGNNDGHANDFEFLAGCNRFAVDNPTPTVTKRIAFYGNTEDITK